jgi:hypothetical protein
MIKNKKIEPKIERHDIRCSKCELPHPKPYEDFEDGASYDGRNARDKKCTSCNHMLTFNPFQKQWYHTGSHPLNCECKEYD